MAQRRREIKPVHRFSVGDKVWLGADFGEVIDMNAVRLRVVCIDSEGKDYTRWVDPKQIRRRRA